MNFQRVVSILSFAFLASCTPEASKKLQMNDSNFWRNVLEGESILGVTLVNRIDRTEKLIELTGFEKFASPLK